MITLRAYGTWLHGDHRGWVDRFHNQYRTPKPLPNPLRRGYDRRIRETCEIRNWRLWALNSRTNYVHSVVSANCKSKKVRAALKANANRAMRESGCWQSERTPWAGEGSRVFLWTQQQLFEAIHYVPGWTGRFVTVAMGLNLERLRILKAVATASVL